MLTPANVVAPAIDSFWLRSTVKAVVNEPEAFAVQSVHIPGTTPALIVPPLSAENRIRTEF